MSKFITTDPPYNAGLYPTTAGFLQLENGEPLDGFSRIVTDQLGTTSPLSLSSTNLSITSYSNTYPPAIKAAPSFASTSGLDIWGATNSATEYEFIRFRNFNGALLSQIYNYNSLLTFKVGSNEIVNLSATQARIGSTNNNTPLALFGSNSLSAIFNISNISVGGDKTFTFPNANMTFAGIDIAQTFTAAQTFNSPSEAGLNGSPIRILTDPWTSGNANQNHPLLLFGPHGGGIWAASPNGGTYIGINAVASFPGNFLDFHVNGGASVFKVAASGAVTTTAAGVVSTSALSLTGAWLTGQTPTFTGVSYNSGTNTTTYTVVNNLQVGQTVTITGITNSLAITGTSGSSGAVVYACANTAGIYVGQVITIAGSSVSGLNTTQTVDLVTTNTSFRTTIAVNPTGATTATCTYTGTNNQYNQTGNVASATSTLFTIVNTLSALGGTWSSGGVANVSGATQTNIKPLYLIEPTGVTSTGWNLRGTALGVNAAAGFTGFLIDLQLNGASRFSVSSGGLVNCVTLASQNSACNRYSDSNSGAINWAFVNSATAAVVYQTTGLYSALTTDVINTSAIFELRSTTKGFLPPRMTTTQRDNIASPVAGLLIYNTTTAAIEVYTTTWTPIVVLGGPGGTV